MSEEVRGSTTSPETKMRLHTNHKGYEFMGNERFKDKYYGIYFGWVYSYLIVCCT